MKNLIIVILILSLFNSLTAQLYEGKACTCCGNKELPAILKAKEEFNLDSHSFGSYANWSSSFLKSTGKQPPLPPEEWKDHDETLDQWEEAIIANHEWTCKYSAHSIQDGNTKTAWVEGAKGYGIGELVLVELHNIDQPVRIWAGYGKSDKLHKANSRPKVVNVYVLKAKEVMVLQSGMIFKGLKSVAQQKVTLKDLNDWQKLPLPSFEIEKGEGNYIIAIEILEIYKGTKYEDTCISEVENFVN